MPAHEIIVGVTGGIAAYKAADVVSKLRQADYGVTVVMTEFAQEFVGPLTFQTLSNRPVVAGWAVNAADYNPRHISLARLADVMLIAPCTANIIGKIAHGIADDILTTVALSITCPLVIAPSMNKDMYMNPAVRDNLAILKKRACHVIEPEEGFLACGEVGIGRLADTEEIIKTVEKVMDAQKK